MIQSTKRTNVFVSVVTPPPSFSSPITGSASSDSILISYTLLSSYLARTAQLIFNGPVSSTVVLKDNTLSGTFKLDAHHLSSSSFVQSATTDSLPDGNYTLTLSYADIYGHAAASQTVSFLLKTNTPIPIITKPIAGISIGQVADTLKYNLPFPPKKGSVSLILKNNSNIYSYSLGNGYGSQFFIYGSSSIIPGNYEVGLSYQDSLNNPVATTNIDSVYIGNNTAPSISFNKTPSICQGDSVILTSNASGGNKWYFNSNEILGATNINYSAKSAGNYTLRSTYIGSTNNGYLSPTSNELNVVLNQLPSIIINLNDKSGIANNDGIICSDSSTSLTASGASTYLWGSSETTATIIKSPKTTTTYSVTGIDLNGCTQTNSQTITVNNIPSTPIILSLDTTTIYSGNKNYLVSNGFTVIGGSGGYYQWYVNGSPISGAINNTYKALTSGDYTVDYTDINSCKSSISNTITITVVPLPNANNSNGATGQKTAVDKNGKNIIIF